MFSISAFLLFIPSITLLEYSSSTSIITSSIGSVRFPLSSSLNRTLGLPIVNSKPSLLICSINTPSCNSPRPLISKASLFGFSEKFIATLVSASARRRSLIKVDVTFLPSRPASGESLTDIVTDIVGGSIGVDSSGFVTEGEHIVSDTAALLKPAIQIISPALTFSTATLEVPSNFNNFVNLPVSINLPSKLIAFTVSLTLALPSMTLPTKHLPINGSEPNKVTSIAKGLSI